MKKHIPAYLSAIVAVVVLAAAPPVCGHTAITPPPAAAPAQVYCPVTTEEKIDREIFAEYKGGRVYFCCERCRKKFEREPEKYAEHLVHDAAVGNPKADPEPPALSRETGEKPKDTVPPDGQTLPAGGGHDDAAHDHDEHGPGNGPHWLNWVGGFHPPMTNFPIGVLVAAAVAEALFLSRKQVMFEHAARLGVWFAALTGVAAGMLGWAFGGLRLVDSDPLLLTHRWLGTGTVVWMLVLLWASERARYAGAGRGLYRFLLFGGAALVLATGFFGGALVYGLDHYLP
ncbi:hypothetical protein BH11PLA1_BH11PLA1_12440 [soil metagenome]